MCILSVLLAAGQQRYERIYSVILVQRVTLDKEEDFVSSMYEDISIILLLKSVFIIYNEIQKCLNKKI